MWLLCCDFVTAYNGVFHISIGTSTFHCLGCVPVLYILLLLQGGKVFSIAFAFVYFMVSYA